MQIIAKHEGSAPSRCNPRLVCGQPAAPIGRGMPAAPPGALSAHAAAGVAEPCCTQHAHDFATRTSSSAPPSRYRLRQLAKRQCALPDWQGNQHRLQPPTARHPALAHPGKTCCAPRCSRTHRSAPGLARLDGGERPGHQRQPLRAGLQPLLTHHPRRRFRLWRGRECQASCLVEDELAAGSLVSH